MEEFHKVRRLPPYVFEQVNRLKASARSRGADIVDLGMGNPDLPTPKAIVDKLCEVVRDPRTHRYSSSRGIPGLRRAQAAYYARRFGVKLNPETPVTLPYRANSVKIPRRGCVAATRRLGSGPRGGSRPCRCGPPLLFLALECVDGNPTSRPPAT